MTEQEKKLSEGIIDEMEEYDWSAIVIANYNKFTSELCRLSCVAMLKKEAAVIGHGEVENIYYPSHRIEILCEKILLQEMEKKEAI